MLLKIAKNQLPAYRAAYYTRNWPKHVLTVGLLDHYINRFKKHPEWEDKVNFYKTDSDIDDASFVFDNGFFIYFDSLTNNHQKLKAVIGRLNFQYEKIFHCIRDDFKDLVHEIIKEHSLEKIFDLGARAVFNADYDSSKSMYEALVKK